MPPAGPDGSGARPDHRLGHVAARRANARGRPSSGHSSGSRFAVAHHEVGAPGPGTAVGVAALEHDPPRAPQPSTVRQRRAHDREYARRRPEFLFYIADRRVCAAPALAAERPPWMLRPPRASVDEPNGSRCPTSLDARGASGRRGDGVGRALRRELSAALVDGPGLCRLGAADVGAARSPAVRMRRREFWPDSAWGRSSVWWR